MKKRRIIAIILTTTGGFDIHKVVCDSERFTIKGKNINNDKKTCSYIVDDKKIRYGYFGGIFGFFKRIYPVLVYCENIPEPLNPDFKQSLMTADQWNDLLDDKVIRDLLEPSNKNLLLIVILVLLVVSILLNIFMMGLQQGWFTVSTGG